MEMRVSLVFTYMRGTATYHGSEGYWGPGAVGGGVSHAFPSSCVKNAVKLLSPFPHGSISLERILKTALRLILMACLMAGPIQPPTQD